MFILHYLARHLITGSTSQPTSLLPWLTGFVIFHLFFLNLIFFKSASCIWLAWCLFWKDKKKHVWKCFLSIFCCGALISLELLDFPPIFGHFDAHSHWHFGTAPVNLLFYSFLIDDNSKKFTKVCVFWIFFCFKFFFQGLSSMDWLIRFLIANLNDFLILFVK